MIYRLTRQGTISLPQQARNLTVEEGILSIEHTDGSIEWIPLTNIDSVLIGTDQAWTKAKVNVKEIK